MNRPDICAVITNNDLKAVKEIEPLADLFEVRIDLIGNEWQQIVGRIDKPWIATNRIGDEGGQWRGNEEKRIELLMKAIELGAALVDLELVTSSLHDLVQQVKKRAKCIISSHNFQATPTLNKMKDIIRRQLEAGADICKVVTTAKTPEDNLTAIQLIGEFPDKSLISFCMGESGQMSRVLSPLAGGAFTYASIDSGKESAPGQITVKQMASIYKMIGAK